MRQSMTLDLWDLMEEFTFDEVESSPVSIGSQVAVIDRKEARAIARKASEGCHEEGFVGVSGEREYS